MSTSYRWCLYCATNSASTSKGAPSDGLICCWLTTIVKLKASGMIAFVVALSQFYILRAPDGQQYATTDWAVIMLGKH